VPGPSTIAAVFAGGAAGTAARIAIAEALGFQAFPWATLLANVAGSAVLGYLVVRLIHHAGTTGVAFVGVGVLGSFTTFSAFIAEADLLAAADTAAYVIVSLAAGLVAARLGMAAAR
jgi:CrcB protein